MAPIIHLAVLMLVIYCKASQMNDPVVVTTFESAGLYWSSQNELTGVSCGVKFRENGESDWKKGMELWYDNRKSIAATNPILLTPEFRGSIVGLKPGAHYEIQLTLSDGTSKIVSARTWNDSVPVKSARYLPQLSTSTLIIHQSGTPDGYIVYKPNPSMTATIDVAHADSACVIVNASYVILRRLTLRNGKNHGIVLGPDAHHIIIEYCDISGWGEVLSDGWGKEHDAAIYGKSSQNANIIVQRCRIHHPRSDANNWNELRPEYAPGSNGHPQGPQAIELKNSKGNNVFRYNEIYSDMEHMFNDAIGGYDNKSIHGFPGPDSDIYGNIIMNCWDNPVEVDGGGKNVRVWGNYFDFSYTGISVIPVALGPVYIFRNVCNKLFKDEKFDRSTRFIKAGQSGDFGDGRVYLLHNTMLQEFYNGNLMGGSCGIANTGVLTNYITRNNIWYTFSSEGLGINDEKNTDTSGQNANSFDFDLYNGIVTSADPDKEKHGFHVVPKWADDTFNMYNPLLSGKISIALAANSPGFDAGARLDNFNDIFDGASPDIGACESGSSMEFGCNAYSRPAFINQKQIQKNRNTDLFSINSNDKEMLLICHNNRTLSEMSIIDLKGSVIFSKKYPVPVAAIHFTFEAKQNLSKGVYTISIKSDYRINTRIVRF